MRRKIFSKKMIGGDKMNNIGKLILLPFVFLLMVGIAQATITDVNLTKPAPGDTVALTYELLCNASADDFGDGTNLTQAQFYYGSTSIGTNSTVNLTGWTLTWDSTAVADHIADFKCTVTDSNSTTKDNTSLAVIIDNRVPECTSWTLPTGNNDEIEPGDTVKVNLNGTDGEDSTCSKLTFDNNIFTPTLAAGGGSCSWQADGEPPEGDYDVEFTVSDGTNSTTCSLSDIIVQEDVNTPAQVWWFQQQQEEAEAKATKDQKKTLGIILAIGLLVYWVWFKKK